MKTKQSGESALLLLDVVKLLQERNAQYAVIGALAASVHGAVRASMDADVVLSVGIHEAKSLERTFSAAGFITELTVGDAEDPIPGLLRLRDLHDNRVDLLIGLRGMEPKAFSRVLEVPFQGEVLRFIGREDFIAMKAFAGGPLDLIDAARAISAAGHSLDLELVRRLAKSFGAAAAASLERLLAR
jgi:predicted nucleotidyltransferase